MNKQEAVRQKLKGKKNVPKVSPAALGFRRTGEGGLVQAPCVCPCVLGQVSAPSGRWSAGHRPPQTTPCCLQGPALPLPPPRRLPDGKYKGGTVTISFGESASEEKHY